MLTSVGNRPAWHYREFVAPLAKCFDRFVCNEQKRYRRGRAAGEIPALLRSELLMQGIAAQSIDIAHDYESGLRALSGNPQPGDLVVVLGGFRREDFATLRAAFARVIDPNSIVTPGLVPGVQ